LSSDVAWLAVAFIAVWAGIGGYLLSLSTRQRKLEQRIERIERSEERERSERVEGPTAGRAH
jgi:CcmD family protein